MKPILFTLLTLTSISAYSMDLGEVQDYLNESDAQVSAQDYCTDPDNMNEWPCNLPSIKREIDQENKRLMASIKKGSRQ